MSVRYPLLNRELGILGFNERVLAQAADPQVPLLERLRFICITSSNLDEFFEVRMAGLQEQIRDNPGALTPDGMSLQHAYDLVVERAQRLVHRQYTMLHETVLPALEQEGIYFHASDSWNDEQLEWARRYFLDELLPVLTPIGLDPAHPFPRVLNKSLNFVVELEGRDAFGRQAVMGIVQAPRALPRVVRMPHALSGFEHGFVLLSSFMQRFVGELFPQLVVKSCNQFRITRNSELFVDEDEITNLRVALQGELPARHLGNAVRLEVSADTPLHIVRRLLEESELGDKDCYRVAGSVNLVRLMQIPDLVDRPDLKFTPFTASTPAVIANAPTMFDAIDAGDILLHHPYESFQPVLELLQQAARDPSVVAIKQTIYRTGTDSPLMDALMEAARNGKEVTVVVELLARFDEETNINWASQLEAVGAHVVYGVVGHKCHAKMMLIVRRVVQAGKASLRRYVHLGTGNYHPRTARLYTDFGLMTADQKICEDVHHVFQQLTGIGGELTLHELWQSPFTLHPRIIESIRAEIDNAQAGKRAHRRENERAAGAVGDRRAVRSVAGRRQGRSDRARRLRAEARCAGAVGKHHGALDRRPLPRTPPHLLFPCGRRRGRLSVECRLDGPQPVPPRRSRVPDPRAQAEAARDRRGAVGVPRRQPVGMADAQRRPLSPAPHRQDDPQRPARAAREVLFVSCRRDADRADASP